MILMGATALDPNLRQYLSEESFEKMRSGLRETLQSLISVLFFIKYISCKAS